jgi:DNA-binding XRE family transcriptional regulator
MIDLQKAFALADRLTEQLEGQPAHALALRLRKMLQPPPTMREILAKVQAKDETERARLIGVSRQGLYNWMHETSRPSTFAAHRISELTGVPIDTIRNR